MSDLSDIARQILDADRSAGAPTSAQRARVRAFVETHAHAQVPPSTSAVLWHAGLVGTMLVGVIAALVLVRNQRAHPQDSMALGVTVQSPSQLLHPVAHPVAMGAPSALPAAAAPNEAVAVTTAGVIAPRETTPRVRAIPSVSRRSASPQGTLDEELALLGAARRDLREGAADRALVAIDTHAARFPNGMLRDERQALRILALCATGRVIDARAEADRFLRDAPHSMLTDRVHSSCGVQPH